MLARKNRLTQKRDFQQVKTAGRQVNSRFFSLGSISTGQEFSRFGFIATKRLGNAVQRHRAARLLREAVRLTQPAVKAGYDFVLVARRRILEVKMPAVKKELEKVLKQEGLTSY